MALPTSAMVVLAVTPARARSDLPKFCVPQDMPATRTRRGSRHDPLRRAPASRWPRGCDLHTAGRPTQLLTLGRGSEKCKRPPLSRKGEEKCGEEEAGHREGVSERPGRGMGRCTGSLGSRVGLQGL